MRKYSLTLRLSDEYKYQEAIDKVIPTLEKFWGVVDWTPEMLEEYSCTARCVPGFKKNGVYPIRSDMLNNEPDTRYYKFLFNNDDIYYTNEIRIKNIDWDIVEKLNLDIVPLEYITEEAISFTTLSYNNTKEKIENHNNKYLTWLKSGDSNDWIIALMVWD